MARKFGLIGYPLSHSFSKKYFTDKFEKESIHETSYENFPIEDIGQMLSLFENHPALIGLNVTIPYKELVLEHLDELARDAKEIGAVNTIKRCDGGKLKGYNSDIYGFGETLHRFVKSHHPSGVLILGTGGASKAVRYVCEKMGFHVRFVSRKESSSTLSYAQLNREVIHQHLLIINTTPLGMYPDINEFPPIPYHHLLPQHYLLDLIYNPAETAFLQRGAAMGCQVKNGLEMLILQAEKSWSIWNDPDC
ncbi:MAG: shikimate dehydrogenase [Saprospiraceae bacterium]|nr:shikimate dehydrogenase [Saprospiraceae bacterium]